MTKSFDVAVIDTVIANRALARMGAVDAYGHVSVRHPDASDRFLISRSRSPDLVDRNDIMQVDLNGNVCNGDSRTAYLERFLHAAVYAARPDVNAVVHGHAPAIMPFAVTGVQLRPVSMTADEYGAVVPFWDIRDSFGDETDLLIVNMEQGRDLARALGASHHAVIMRGHGFVAAGRSASHVIRLCRALLDNATLQLNASRLGAIIEMSTGELAARQRTLSDDESPGRVRDFEYEAIMAGLRGLLVKRRRLLGQLEEPSTMDLAYLRAAFFRCSWP